MTQQTSCLRRPSTAFAAVFNPALAVTGAHTGFCAQPRFDMHFGSDALSLGSITTTWEPQVDPFVIQGKNVHFHLLTSDL